MESFLAKYTPAIKGTDRYFDNIVKMYCFLTRIRSTTDVEFDAPALIEFINELKLEFKIRKTDILTAPTDISLDEYFTAYCPLLTNFTPFFDYYVPIRAELNQHIKKKANLFVRKRLLKDYEASLPGTDYDEYFLSYVRYHLAIYKN